MECGENKLTNRFAIDDNTDFSTLEPQVRALADASPGERERMSRTMSVRGEAPATAASAKSSGADEGSKKGKKDGSGKGRSAGGKDKRRESGGGDGGRKKQKV